MFDHKVLMEKHDRLEGSFMTQKLSSELFCLSLISLVMLSPVSVLADVSVGVKEGDWIEYNVSYTGSPPNNYPKRVRIEVTSIQGTSITADLTVERLDGTSDTNSGTFNLETGVPDLLLIPVNLDIGDEFYHEDFGNIAIGGTEEHTYADANRLVNYATINQIVFRWDKTTGILLQSDQSADDFTQKFLVDETNIWQSQIFGLEPTLFYVLIVAIAIAAIVPVVYLRRR